jgi:hypothetical protein
MAGHTAVNLAERSPVRRSRSVRLLVHLHLDRGAEEAQISGRLDANCKCRCHMKATATA